MTQSIRIVTFKNEFKRDGSPVADNAAELTGRIDIPVEMLDTVFAELQAQQHREHKGQHYASLKGSLFRDAKGKRVHCGPVEVIKPFTKADTEQTKLDTSVTEKPAEAKK